MAIALGAALGANARYWVGQWVAVRLGTGFPYGTLLVNVTGSFMLGLVTGWLLKGGDMSTPARLFLAVGFLGSYTTFSSFSVDTLLLLENGKMSLAFANMIANNAIGLTLAFAGFRLAHT
jgi:CrcB protein